MKALVVGHSWTHYIYSVSMLYDEYKPIRNLILYLGVIRSGLSPILPDFTSAKLMDLQKHRTTGNSSRNSSYPYIVYQNVKICVAISATSARNALIAPSAIIKLALLS